jgi:hypothetical protein
MRHRLQFLIRVRHRLRLSPGALPPGQNGQVKSIESVEGPGRDPRPGRTGSWDEHELDEHELEPVRPGEESIHFATTRHESTTVLNDVISVTASMQTQETQWNDSHQGYHSTETQWNDSRAAARTLGAAAAAAPRRTRPHCAQADLRVRAAPQGPRAPTETGPGPLSPLPSRGQPRPTGLIRARDERGPG